MELFRADVKINKTLNYKYKFLLYTTTLVLSIKFKFLGRKRKSNAGGINFYSYGQNFLKSDRRFPKKSLQTGSPVGAWNGA